MAQTSLTKLGVWDKLKSKIVTPEYAIDAYKLVASGHAQAGITYRTCPLDSNPEKIEKSTVKIAYIIPADSYDRDDCRFHGVITTSCTHKAEAAALLTFLASDEAGAIMEPKGLPMRHDKSGTPVAATSAAPPSDARVSGTPKVTVVAFYPDTEGHANIKQMVQGLNKRYPGKVKAEFVDFTSEEGYKRMTALGISCGCISIDGKQDFDLTGPGGKARHVNFARAMGGEWQAADLDVVVQQEIARAYKRRPLPVRGDESSAQQPAAAIVERCTLPRRHGQEELRSSIVLADPYRAPFTLRRRHDAPQQLPPIAHHDQAAHFLARPRRFQADPVHALHLELSPPQIPPRAPTMRAFRSGSFATT